jgi:hypothetical protein
LRHVHCIDNTTGDTFEFHFSPEQLIRFASTPNPVSRISMPEDVVTEMLEELIPSYRMTGWEWQGDMIDWWIHEFVTAVLKARQLGVTWCAAGVGLWYATQLPGTKVLCQSIGEPEASDIIDHAWEMYRSLIERKPHLVAGLKLLRPTNGRRPHLEMEFEHPDGRTSMFHAMPSTTSKGHGRTASFVIMDEFARHPYARESYKAIVPTQAGSNKVSGRTAIISTGNGISTAEDAGNYFHHLWANSRIYGVATRFLRWDVNPDRDQTWYDRVARKLPTRDRGEQYPMDEREAFILTGDPYFDVDSLVWFADNAIKEPLYSFEWEVLPGEQRAKQRKGEWGPISVLLPPASGRDYAIGVDVATGYGRDFSAAYVIDLHSASLVCEFHAKMDSELFAEQLHFLGRWYNTALIAVEKGGGWGESVIVPLRDGKNNRPRYPRLYRHTQPVNLNAAEQSRSFGVPMNMGTRMLIISQLEKALRERLAPWLTIGLLHECHSFVYREQSPSPAASDGAHDDRVMAASIAYEMYRRFGSHPKVTPRRSLQNQLDPYPWR